jgi:hypothetical protein
MNGGDMLPFVFFRVGRIGRAGGCYELYIFGEKQK